MLMKSKACLFRQDYNEKSTFSMRKNINRKIFAYHPQTVERAFYRLVRNTTQELSFHYFVENPDLQQTGHRHGTIKEK